MEFDHGTCRNLAAGFACVAICSKNNHVLQLFVCAFAWLLEMTMNGELVNLLQASATGAGRNLAFGERAQKILE